MDRSAFFSAVRHSLLPGGIKQTQVDGFGSTTKTVTTYGWYDTRGKL